MSETDMLFFVMRLFFGGVIAFLAIMLWSKTRDFSWMFLVLGAVTEYSALVFELLLKLGVVSVRKIAVFGFEIPLIQLVLAIVPNVFIILAFILMLIKSNNWRK